MLALQLSLLAVLALGASAPSAADAASCAPEGSKLVSRNDDVRVYQTAYGPIGAGQTTKTYVCSDRTGKRALLTTTVQSPRGPVGFLLSSIRYAGRYFAAAFHYSRADGFTYGGEALIVRVDLEDGGVARTVPCPGSCRGGRVRAWDVTDLVLNRKGWIAWIARVGRPQIKLPKTFVVGRRDSRGIAVVDTSDDVEKQSLADSGTTIFWIAHGGPQDQDLY